MVSINPLSATDLILELGQRRGGSLGQLGLRRPCLLQSTVHAEIANSITYMSAVKPAGIKDCLSNNQGATRGAGRRGLGVACVCVGVA